MLLTRQDETELLTALHEGPFEEPLWSTFLRRLRARVRADYVTIVFRRGEANTSAFELFSGRNSPAALQRRYFEELYRSDPMPYQRLRPGRVYSLAEFLDPGDPDHLRYVSEFLEPSGMSHLRIVRIVEPGGMPAWLIAARAERDFDAADAALLAAVAPHLAIALRVFATLERERMRHSIAADAIRRLNFGWLTLDADGRLVEADAQAGRLLRSASIGRMTGRGRLLLDSPKADRALAEALRDFVHDPDARPRALHISDEPWLDMLLVPVRERDAAGALKPVMIAYVHGDEQPSADRVHQLVDLFGLSPAEARFALALSRGRSIAEAGEELGLTIETARNYSKKVYAKTGARGQADLVRLILASVVALA